MALSLRWTIMSELDQYQWLMLAKLIERCGSIKDSLQMMKKMYPKCERVKQIEESLLLGNPIQKVLKRNKFEKKIAYYCKFTSLNKAIVIVYNRQQKQNANRSKLLSNLSYQIVLLIASLIVMSLFMNLVLPTMLNSLSIENASTERLVKIFSIINILKNIFIITIFVSISLGSYLYFSEKLTLLWAVLHRMKLDKSFKIIATYNLVGDLKILLSNGISLHEALDIIRLNRDDQLAGLLAFHFRNSLEDGIDFEKSLDNEYFDEQFHSICLWGLKNDDFESSLDDYQQIIELKLSNLIKRITKTFQIICYLFVSIVIVLAYEVLMIPLDMLEGLDLF